MSLNSFKLVFLYFAVTLNKDFVLYLYLYLKRNDHTYGKTHKVLHNFNIDGNIIECTDYAKLLGVTFDWQLKFDKHVDDICVKASKQINALSRLSKKLDLDAKMVIFKSFTLSNFIYCPLVWMFCGKANIDKIEHLQYRALKFVFNEYDETYENLLSRCNLKSILAGRIHRLAIEVFKCVHKKSPPYVNNMFEVNETVYNLRDPYPLKQEKFKTITYGYRSFHYMGSKLWNMLPNEIKSETDIGHFKNLLTMWEGQMVLNLCMLMYLIFFFNFFSLYHQCI